MHYTPSNTTARKKRSMRHAMCMAVTWSNSGTDGMHVVTVCNLGPHGQNRAATCHTAKRWHGIGMVPDGLKPALQHGMRCTLPPDQTGHTVLQFIAKSARHATRHAKKRTSKQIKHTVKRCTQGTHAAHLETSAIRSTWHPGQQVKRWNTDCQAGADEAPMAQKPGPVRFGWGTDGAKKQVPNANGFHSRHAGCERFSFWMVEMRIIIIQKRKNATHSH